MLEYNSCIVTWQIFTFTYHFKLWKNTFIAIIICF